MPEADNSTRLIEDCLMFWYGCCVGGLVSYYFFT